MITALEHSSVNTISWNVCRWTMSCSSIFPRHRQNYYGVLDVLGVLGDQEKSPCWRMEDRYGTDPKSLSAHHFSYVMCSVTRVGGHCTTNYQSRQQRRRKAACGRAMKTS
jgi:hypothetical protein